MARKTAERERKRGDGKGGTRQNLRGNGRGEGGGGWGVGGDRWRLRGSERNGAPVRGRETCVETGRGARWWAFLFRPRARGVPLQACFKTPFSLSSSSFRRPCVRFLQSPRRWAPHMPTACGSACSAPRRETLLTRPRTRPWAASSAALALPGARGEAWRCRDGASAAQPADRCACVRGAGGSEDAYAGAAGPADAAVRRGKRAAGACAWAEGAGGGGTACCWCCCWWGVTEVPPALPPCRVPWLPRAGGAGWGGGGGGGGMGTA